MNLDKYSRQVSLICPTCGNDQFSYDDDKGDAPQIMTCAACRRETTKDDLIVDNGETITAHSEEMGEQIVKDIAGDFRKQLQRAFRDSKHIKIR